MTAILSLCTGTGALDSAVEQVVPDSFTAWFSEYDTTISDWYMQWSPGSGLAAPLGDLKAIDWQAFKTAHPLVDWSDVVLTGGYPCQPFSQAGKRLGDQDPRHLWPYIRDAIRVLRPGLVVLENVRGHLSLGFPEVLGDLAAIGFDAEWSVVKASDVGAPHQRARLYFVARPTVGWAAHPSRA